MPDEITTASTASIKTIKNLKTDQIIYPVTKANAVYLNDNQTVTGSINELDKQLQQYIINKHAHIPTPSIGADDYYVRIGINKGSDGNLPYAYMDIRDMAQATQDPEWPGYYYGKYNTNFQLFSQSDTDSRSQMLMAYEIGASKNGTRLSRLSGNADTTGMAEITTTTALDEIQYNNTLYWTSKGVNLGIDTDQNYFIIKQIQPGTNYRFQFAYGYNLQTPYIKVRSKNASGWGTWKTLCQDRFSLAVTAGTGISNGFIGGCKNGFAYLSFACTMAAGTYTGQSSVLFTVSKPPLRECRTLVSIGSAVQILILRVNGQAVLNNNYTISSGAQYIQGNITYPYQ